MESFYDIGTSCDLKDIWEDSELDPTFHDVLQGYSMKYLKTDGLKFSSEADMPDWFLERADIKMPQVILHDKLISDALLGTLPIKAEHSYSLNSDGDSNPDSPRSLHAKIDDMDEDCYPAISMSTATSHPRRLLDTSSNNSINNESSTSVSSSPHNNSSSSHNSRSGSKIQQQTEHERYRTINHTQMETGSISGSEIDIDDSCIKDEPMSPTSSCPPSPSSQTYGISLNMANVAALTNTDLVFEHKNGSLQLSPASQSLLKNQQIIFNGPTNGTSQRTVIPKLNIKMEPRQSLLFGLPPTPPSSLPSDESEGNQSPEHHLASPLSPQNTQQTTVVATVNTVTKRNVTTSAGTSSTILSNSPCQVISNGRAGYNGSTTRQPIHTPLISSQPKGSTGTLVLTEEEKRTLLAEGYPIPTRLPLTKAEEKSLKKIRRKIKNKISAQESRRKKKEYMDQLERKVEILVSENTDYRKRVESLEDSNANLINQLAKLQALINRQNIKKL
uniref:Putative creb/atf family transcription factor n=1 Tax=Tabanus bromius TaxID=304241 RepID=A0A0K8TSB6_TABBR